MKNIVPKYWNEKQNLIALVVGTAIFAEIFILIFRPFDSGNWVERAGYALTETQGDWLYLAFATAAVLTAMGVIAISRSIMYRYAKQNDISYWGYGLWILGEIISMATIYTLTAYFVVDTLIDPLETLKLAFGYTACILLIPYVIFLMYFSMKDKSYQLQKIQQMWHTTSKSQDIQEQDALHFYDERGDLKLSIRAVSLYYIESADNYVQIHYMNSGKMQKLMLRNSLKKLEEQFAEHGVVRCHRSYLVNINNVKCIRKTNEGLVLDFDDEKIQQLPVSKTYSKQLFEQIS